VKTETELRQIDADLEKRGLELKKKEGEIANRELAVTEREQNADAGFADKARTLAEESSRQHKANQEWLRQLAESLAKDRQSLETDIAAVREGKLSFIEEEMARIKTKRLEDAAKAEQAERERIRSEIAKEREVWAKEQENARKQLEAGWSELEKQKGAVFALQSENECRKAELESVERSLERKEERLERQWQKKNDGLDDVIESRLEEERKSLAAEKQSFKNENDRLRGSLRNQTELFGEFDQLKRQLAGKDPAEIIRELNSKTDELKRLREELAVRPAEEMREQYKLLKDEADRQKARADDLEKQAAANNTAVAETANLRRKNSELEAENKSLAQKASIFEGAANEAQAELNRLRAAYERPAEVQDRYREIEMPHIKMEKAKKPVKDDGIDELTWLKGVGSACNTYGLHFNQRILKAFHTALKTAEWSPLTVLAGVSGTGKSELPRLYAHFGGLCFESLAVQPNWDSQESMLGFFNSIDNKFDAQPVLRFLAQSQKPWIDPSDDNPGYPGLSDAVCLVLLDEMNLAHPELYFAEFLSKLELRRGMKGGDVPSLPVKIGAGMSPYQLPLGRNVLWAGTMNQDETTKSLSDKVLDRSIIIHFPRPTELKRRMKLEALDDKNSGPVLHKTAWQSWLARESSFSEEDIKPFKSFIEQMNVALAAAGRAIGHRVWQSVEYYMANYPDVRAAGEDKEKKASAMHTAFEDQLVQKVMPKLRGIDTRGKSKTECLDKIKGQIIAGIGGKAFNLAGDFDLACELGYGQFIWQSANYLKDEPDTSEEISG
jgi:hypothetical protein